MNVERLTHLADFLDQLDAEKFDMTTFYNKWRDEAGMYHTSACIAGWACFIWDKDNWEDYCAEVDNIYSEEPINWEPFSSVKAVLGLTDRQGSVLCYCNGKGESDWKTLLDELYARDLHDSQITPKMAAKVIRHLIKTGIVDWSKAFEKEGEAA